MTYQINVPKLLGLSRISKRAKKPDVKTPLTNLKPFFVFKSLIELSQYTKKQKKSYKDEFDNCIDGMLEQTDTLFEVNVDVKKKKSNVNVELRLANHLNKIHDMFRAYNYAPNTLMRKFTDVRKQLCYILRKYIVVDETVQSVDENGVETTVKLDILEMNQKIELSLQLIMYHFINMTRDEKINIKKISAKAVEKKNSNLKPVILEDFEDVLNELIMKLLADNSDILTQILAVSLVTGRRNAEVVRTMELDFTNWSPEHNKVVFTGQLKLKNNNVKPPYEIPLLLPADKILIFKNAYQQILEYRKSKQNRRGEYIRNLDGQEFTNYAKIFRRKIEHPKFKALCDVILSKNVHSLRWFYTAYFLNKRNTSDNEFISTTERVYVTELLGHDERGDSAKYYQVYSIISRNKYLKLRDENPTLRSVKSKSALQETINKTIEQYKL